MGCRWEEMQKVFRDELDLKHNEHIAFRKEQEIMRKERKDLDMTIQVIAGKYPRLGSTGASEGS